MTKKSIQLLTALTAGAAFAASAASGQIVISSLDPIEEGFDSPTATVPTGWSIAGFAGSGTAMVFGGTTVTNTHYALRPTADATNNAFGGKIAASGDPGTLTLQVRNETPGAITGFEIAWDYLQYTAGNRASTVDFSYSLNGSTFVTTGLSFTSGGSNYTATGLTGLNSGGGSFVATPSIFTQSNVGSIALAATLPVDGEVWFRFTWATGSGGGNNAHLGIDNFSLTPIPEPSTYAAIVGALFLGLVLYRRRQK